MVYLNLSKRCEVRTKNQNRKGKQMKKTITIILISIGLSTSLLAQSACNPNYQSCQPACLPAQYGSEFSMLALWYYVANFGTFEQLGWFALLGF